MWPTDCRGRRRPRLISIPSLFAWDKRGPVEDLRLHFDAVSSSDEEEKSFVQLQPGGMLLQQEARSWRTDANGGERK